MTTPTREQVVQWASDTGFDIERADQYHDRDEVLDRGNIWITDWLESFATIARADLEASIEDQATEISKLIAAVADHVTVRAEQRQTITEQATEIAKCRQIDANVLVSLDKEINELRQQLAAEQAYAEQLRDAASGMFGPTNTLRDDRYDVLSNALSIPHDTTALQEYGANLLEPTKANLSDAEQLIQRMIEKEDSKVRWIPVSERLPKLDESPSGHYWGMDENDPDTPPDILEFFNNRNGIGFCHEACGIVHGVTHWQPVIPPKVDDSTGRPESYPEVL